MSIAEEKRSWGSLRTEWNKVKSLRAERWIPHENIFVSADVGAEKPDRKIFEYAERTMELEEAAIWFVGDSYELDVKGAVNAGWNAVWMNRRKRKAPRGAMIVKHEHAGRIAGAETEEALFGFVRMLFEGVTK